MSRSASTSARTEEYYLKQISPNNRGVVALEVFNTNTDTYDSLDDLDVSKGIRWTVSGKKEKFANFSLTPLAGTISFSVVNKNGEWSDGSGTAKENVIDTETKIRLKAGFLSATAGDSATSSINLFDTYGTTVKSFFWHTASTTSGEVGVIAERGGTVQHFVDLFTAYDSVNYDSGTYSPDAYTVQTYDTLGSGYQNIVSFTITANNTDGTVYYRTFNTKGDISYSQSTNWTNSGALVNGTKTVTVGATERYLQVAVLYDGLSSWDEDLEISDITVTYQSYVDWLYTSVYYLDTPSFSDPPAPQMPMISCKGRDAFKRAIGTDINLEDLSAGVDVDALIKSVADKVGIEYNSTSIADLSSFADRVLADGVDIKKADKVFDLCMQIINPTGYQMYMEYDSTLDENILFVQPKPTVTEADGAFSYRNYISIGNNSKNADKILNRLTVISNSQVADKEEQLDQDTFTTTGSKTLSWVGDAEFKRVTIDQPDEVTITNFSVNPTSITFDLDVLSTGGVTFTVYGNKWNTAPNFEGEAIDISNMVNYSGTTSKIENPLVVSDAECKSIADSFISTFGTPTQQAKKLTWPYLYLLPEINDIYLMWRRHIFNDNLFFITQISYNWSISSESTQFNFDDSGLNFEDLGDFIYDDVLDYDKGYLYDMGISTPLSTDSEIDTASDAVKVRNYSFS